MMLRGIDISHWNNINAIDFSDIDFVICKASEGVYIIDENFDKNVEMAKKSGIGLLGAYHFANTSTNPIFNANNFIRKVNPYLDNPEPMLLVLDIEGRHAIRPGADEWALQFVKHVEKMTGIKPLIYTSESLCSRFVLTAKNDNGLWVAKWGKTKPKKIAPWKIWALWQYHGTVLDKNYFNGTKEQFEKYCGR